MSRLKLSELTQATAKQNTDLLYIVQSGTSKSITVANLLANANVQFTANTTVVTEGANLYYSNARVQAYLDTQGYSNAAAISNLDLFTTANLAEGSNLYFTNARVIAALTAGQGISLSANGMLALLPVANTYATLIAANTAGAGARSFITDANTAVFYEIVDGGGANAVPVFSDGSVWRVG